MSALHADDFVAFHREVHGYPPFPWQERLLRSVLAERRFPALVDVPTGAGKTTLMDIAVFALACSAFDATTPRWMPRRILLVVDRRVIVDQAGERALRLAEHLARARRENDGAPTVRRVAEALCSLGGDHPLVPAILRGGTLRDDGWAHHPAQPVLGASTVDQVGSRLLFQGYGVSAGAASIHAGLLGRDTLYLLDEVHLSTPFRDTLRQLERYQRAPWCEIEVGTPNQVVELSATPGQNPLAGDTFSLETADREHPLLQQRLATPKRARLVETKTGTDANFVSTITSAVRELAKEHRTIGVVVNRVAAARTIHRALADAAKPGSGDVHLLTGRMRELDRQDLLDGIRPRIAAGRERTGEETPLVLVATQCIEAGADLDLDALITECASLDALRQRFGRVDRLGRYGTSDAVIVARKTDVSASASADPIYGHALRSTWEWLHEVRDEEGCVDFGIVGLEGLEWPDDVLPPREQAPILLPAHLDSWAQTRPAPALQPDISLWLHGPEERARDVQIVWRADLEEDELVQLLAAADDTTESGSTAARARRNALLDRLEVSPPAAPETLSIPVSAARRWLLRDDLEEVGLADVEGMRDDTEDPWRSRRSRPFLVWSGEDSRVEGSARQLRPGMTIVVPSGYGGLRHGAWDPAWPDPVRDLGDRAQLVARGRAVLRLNDRVYPELKGSLPRPPSGTDGALVSREENVESILPWLEGLDTADTPPWLRLTARLLHGTGLGRRRIIWETLNSESPDAGPCWILGARARTDLDTLRELRAVERREAREGAVGDASIPEDDAAAHFVADFDPVDTSSFVHRDVALRDHLEAVGALVERHAKHLGLDPDVTRTLVMAGRLHDVGKADRRFQLWLHGGDEIDLAAHGRLLAKGVFPAQSRAARRAARERARYPEGLRHEMASTAMLAESPELLDACPDPALLLHLVASHHGWARPLAPAIEDPAPVTIRYGGPDEPGADPDLPALTATSDNTLARLDSGVTQRFWDMNRRYGWHGLAWLEAVIRLADHRVSRNEEGA
ncbi:MAG: type I-U CRISPR-associated helicase/endonuclease Cas3 [Deltaproteobacteria bacterium]|nr:MAG: type I-U CRISPR-associated helicase/endonuclease Cas3 [Deltaproteobacteria bacterium]